MGFSEIQESIINGFIKNDNVDFSIICYRIFGKDDSLLSEFYKDFSIKGEFLAKINKCNDCDELNTYKIKALDYLDLFTKIALKSKKQHLKKNSDMDAHDCFTLALMFINIIENCIIAPINMRLFELNAKESNYKADISIKLGGESIKLGGESIKLGKKSIQLGIASIVIGLLISVASMGYSNCSSKQNDKNDGIYQTTNSIKDNINRISHNENKVEQIEILNENIDDSIKTTQK